MFIHQQSDWYHFRWDTDKVLAPLAEASRLQGRLFGQLLALDHNAQISAMAENMAKDIITSSETESIILNPDEVRSSVAKRLGIDNVRKYHSSHYVDSIVAVMFDALKEYDQPIDKAKLCRWQAAFFPTGYSEGFPIESGQYRSHAEQVVSGFYGREKVHYVAPAPERLDHEMQAFIDWYNSDTGQPWILRSAIAHFWFVTIHPFEDGNGRLARLLGDLLLARSDNSKLRYYNLSSIINIDKRHYFRILEQTQRGDSDITQWLVWYLNRLIDAIKTAEATLKSSIAKGRFWAHASAMTLSDRQIKMLNLFLDGYSAKITTKNWSALAKCSKITAVRDINQLQQLGLLRPEVEGAKRPSFAIVYPLPIEFSSWFTDIEISPDGISAKYKDGQRYKNLISPFDYQRYADGELMAADLLEKYFAHLY